MPGSNVKMEASYPSKPDMIFVLFETFALVIGRVEYNDSSRVVRDDFKMKIKS